MSRWILGGVLALAGAAMLARPERYRSGSYSVVFGWVSHLSCAPTTTWGVAFLAAGLLGWLSIPSHRWRHVDLGLLAMTLVMALWCWGLWAAVVEGKAETFGGPIWPTAVLVLTVVNAGRDGLR